MLIYIIKRLLWMLPTLLGITLLTFFVIKLAPGDPVKLKLMFASKGLDPNQLAGVMASETPPLQLPLGYVHVAERVSGFVHGAGEPKQQTTFKAFKWMGENTLFYGKWLKNIFRLDFGRSFKDKLPVTTKIVRALPVTLALNFLTISLIYMIAVPLGIWSAGHQGQPIDKVVMVKLFILYSLPTFWVASMLLSFLASGDHFNLFPIAGITSAHFSTLGFFGKLGDLLWHLFLPVFVSSLGGLAFLTRFSRSNFLDVIRQDYMRTARAKGLAESVVLYKHGLRNALIPFVTMMGTLLPGLLGGSIMIEQIFNIPGMGMLSFEAVLGRDHNVIMGIATIDAFLTLLGLLISDLLYGWVDPRIRIES